MKGQSQTHGVRRALACDRQARAVRSLFVTEEAVPNQAPEDVLVRTAFSVVDPEPFLAGCALAVPEAVLIGIVQNEPVGTDLHRGEFVIGVGPLTDLALLAPSRVQAVAPDSGLNRESIPLLLTFSSLLCALGDAGIGLGTQVLVSGDGLTARLTQQLVEMYTGRPPQTVSTIHRSNTAETSRVIDKTGAFDVLIDTTADPGWWPQILPLARDQARILLLLPPWPLVRPFDFYPDIHRRSLSLFTRKIPSTEGPPTPRHADRILRQSLNRGLIRLDGLLFEVDVPSHWSSGTQIHLNAPEGRGILVRWADGGA